MDKRKKKLLLVDDDLSQLAMRKVVLELLGYAVLTAADARQGMQLFETEAPDAVVLDYEMPTVNGGVLAGVTAIMLSGSASVPSSALTDVDTFLAKAIAPSLLKAVIEFLTRGQEVYA